MPECDRSTKFGTRSACISHHRPAVKDRRDGSIWECPTCGQMWEFILKADGKSAHWHWPPSERAVLERQFNAGATEGLLLNQ